MQNVCFIVFGFFLPHFLSPCLWIDRNSFRHEHNRGSAELEVETVTWWVTFRALGLIDQKGAFFLARVIDSEYQMELERELQNGVRRLYIYGKSWVVIYGLRALVFAVVLRPRQRLTTTCNPNSEGFHTLLWPLQVPGTHMVHTHKCRQNINIHFKWIWKKCLKGNISETQVIFWGIH